MLKVDDVYTKKKARVKAAAAAALNARGIVNRYSASLHFLVDFNRGLRRT